MAISSFTKRFSSHPKFVFLLDLLKFVLYNNTFRFDGKYFRQICGIAMGTKLAPALATIVVADLEEQYLRTSPCKPLVWWRYIDDVLAVWTHTKQAFDAFVDSLNAQDPRIRFTFELSPLSTVFLDLRIYKPPDFSTRHRLA